MSEYILEACEYINDYIDLVLEYEYLNESYDDIINKIYFTYVDGYISESEANELINTVCEASKEEIKDWLKKHEYDPKTKTMEVGGHRRRVTLASNEDDSVIYMGDKRAKLDLPKSDTTSGMVAVHGKVCNGGININKHTLRNSSIKDIENTLQHEGGHVTDFSNLRRLQRLPSVFAKYNYNDIPKEYRSKFLSMKKKYKGWKSKGR